MIRKASFIFLVIFSFSSLVFAQSGKYQGHLWKISGNGLNQPSFLYGTMHVSSKVAFHLSDSFYKAIESVDIVALEINPETWMTTMTSDPYIADNYGNAFSIRSDYAEDGFYKSIFQLKEPENKDIGAALSQELGILNSLLYRTSNAGADFQEDTYLDLFIYQAGKKQGKEITGLENLGTTMRLNERAARPEEDKKKRKELRKESEKRSHLVSKMLDGKGFGEVMEDAYRNGDLDLLDSLSRLSSQQKMHDLIIVHRNRIMAENMDSIMQEKRLFAGIGAAHLPNTYGVIELLREKGYTVEPVDRTKSEYGRTAKDKLEETFLTQPFSKQTSFDGLYSLNMPGKLYEFPESGNTMMAVYPDMANGATYVITRMFTFGPLYGKSQEQYMDKIDSLLFENIPGKIMENKRININGFPGFDIENETKKGDFQRYRIMVTPVEIIVFKLGGKKEFEKRSEVDDFFTSIEFNVSETDWAEYSPRNNAYSVELPGLITAEGESNEFMRGFWKKTIQSYDKANGYFAVLNRSYTDWEYMEEDSFELFHMSSQFLTNLNYSVEDFELDSFNRYTSMRMTGVHEDLPPISLIAICKADQYYLLVSQTDQNAARERFENSFSFDGYKYRRPFELTYDTARLFSVITNVRPPSERSYYRYYEEDDSDDSHEEVEKSAVYHSKETDETIYVRYKKFHKYYGETEIDSIWNEYKDIFTEGNSFFVRNERDWKKDESYFYQIELGDTNTNRNLVARYQLKGGVMYSLATETDIHQPWSKYISTFFESFQPWDTAIGMAVLQNKTDSYLADLVSEDSTIREAAYDSWWTVNFENKDVPKLVSAYPKLKKVEHAVDLRRYILYMLGDLKHPNTIPFLQKTYNEIGDTVDFQIAILSSLAQQQTKKSAQLFSTLLMEETPLTNEEEVESLFMPFYDSIALAKALYPEVLFLTSLDEYKYVVVDLLSTLLDSNSIKPKAYKRNLKTMVWQANNALKRQKSQADYSAKEFKEEAGRYQLFGYSTLLKNYMNLLIPYYNKSSVRRFFDRVELFELPGLQLDLAVLKVKNGIDVNQRIWEDFVQNENDIIELYNRLKSIDRLDLFPASVSYNALVNSKYAQSAYINLYKDSLLFVSKDTVQTSEGEGLLYFFKSREMKENDADWNYGYIGLLYDDSDTIPSRLPFQESRINFNKYEDELLQLELAKRQVEMMGRKRYRVEDEPEFEELKNSRSRYYY